MSHYMSQPMVVLTMLALWQNCHGSIASMPRYDRGAQAGKNHLLCFGNEMVVPNITFRWLMRMLSTLIRVVFDMMICDVIVIVTCHHFCLNLSDQSNGDIQDITPNITRVMTIAMDSWAHHRHQRSSGMVAFDLSLFSWFLWMSPKRVDVYKETDDEPSNLEGVPRILYIPNPCLGRIIVTSIVFFRFRFVGHVGVALLHGSSRSIWRMITHLGSEISYRRTTQTADAV